MNVDPEYIRRLQDCEARTERLERQRPLIFLAGVVLGFILRRP